MAKREENKQKDYDIIEQTLAKLDRIISINKNALNAVVYSTNKDIENLNRH